MFVYIPLFYFYLFFYFYLLYLFLFLAMVSQVLSESFMETPKHTGQFIVSLLLGY